MQKLLNVAVVGAGKMAGRHADAIEAGRYAGNLVALADPSDEAVSALGERHPDARTYRSLYRLLEEEPALDVVHICTPPSTHFALAQEALASGCHVYVEKPFTTSVRKAQQLLDLAAARDRHVCAGHQLLNQQSARRTRDLLGRIGSLVHAESYFSFRPARGNGGGGALRADEQLMDILPHPIYLLLDFLTAASGTADNLELTDVRCGPGGTVHAQIREGNVTGNLVVTLEGRPVESYLRLVGTRGSVQADFVRDTVRHQFGAGSSMVAKVSSPYRTAFQLTRETTSSLLRRLMGGSASYPGLQETVDAFHGSIVGAEPAPVNPEDILATVRLCEEIEVALGGQERANEPDLHHRGDLSGSTKTVVVTGGTGFLGSALVSELVAQGYRTRVVARRLPPPWSRHREVNYRSVDLGGDPDSDIFEDADIVIHCAAETSGGWKAHDRNSIRATENVVRLADAAAVSGLLHVSSISVLDSRETRVLNEATPLHENPRSLGPYGWGKLEAERRARAFGQERGIPVKVVRPAAIVDFEDFDPPGRLGRRIGPFFFAVGAPEESLEVVSLSLAASVLSQLAANFDEAPEVLNLVDTSPRTRGELVAELRDSDPSVRVAWIPRPLFGTVSSLAVFVQRLIRPAQEPLDPAEAFASDEIGRRELVNFLDSVRRAPEATVPQPASGAGRGYR